MVAHGGHEGHDMPLQATEGASTSHGMMNMVFFTATNTPLYSDAWTPSSAGAYAGSCIFLIILAIVLRAIFSARSYLDAKALSSALKRRYVVVEGGGAEKIGSDTNSMTGILTTNGVAENVRIVHAPMKPTQPWRFGVDMPRAALTTVAVGVGYLLMLAVMTFNVGYFLSVLAGAFLGELALGRFHHGSMTM